MNIELRVAGVALLVALGFLAGRFSVGLKPAFHAPAAVGDAPQRLASSKLPSEAPPARVDRSPEILVAKVDSAAVGAIDPARPPSEVGLTPPAPPPPPLDLERFSAAAALYRKGDRSGADRLAAQISDPLQRAALEWVALRSGSRSRSAHRLRGRPQGLARRRLDAGHAGRLALQRARPRGHGRGDVRARSAAHAGRGSRRGPRGDRRPAARTRRRGWSAGCGAKATSTPRPRARCSRNSPSS